VRVALPPHWRALYWALAAWSVGACVSLEDGPDADVTVTDDPGLAAGADGATVLVTLPALARGSSGGVPDGAMDEARELATYGDQFSAWESPGPEDPALASGGSTTAYDAVVPESEWAVGTRLYTRPTGLAELLGDALAVWAVDGSLVLSRGNAEPGADRARVTAEGATARP
jgi:uncharacterized protein (TIGR03089 family)